MGMITGNSAGTLGSTTIETATQSASQHNLPEEPLVVIEPSRGVKIGLGDLWTYHELLYFLTWRDIKVRYKQTLLGVSWAILQPVFMMLIFTLFFGNLAKLPSDGVPYPLFAYAGLLPWTFFATAVSSSGNSMLNSAHLITKVYFPRIVVPVAAVAAALVDFLISCGVLVVIMIYYQVTPTIHLLLLPVYTLLLLLLTAAFGIYTAALNVKYRDIRFVLPFVIQLWFFVSPVIYPVGMVTGRWRFLIVLNPMTGIIEGFRSALFGRASNWSLIGVSAAITLVLLAYSLFTFKRMEKSFADII
ncbi:MAG: lipopolysaccharide transport system permease protein [Acidobacteriota bacterium]|jgi:lipopolysaccharide transport system permease protein|nr:lipopolysaccharide transport system permease protein [Acidobacteriota bacterium]